VWLVGTVAALAGAVVAEAFTLVARVADVPMEAAGVWETAAQHNPVGYIVIWSIGGIVLARVFARWAKRPARTFAVTTVAFTVISLAAPALVVTIVVSTRSSWGATHVLAAVVIISILAMRLSGGR
jgi:Family of unknown function (DUF6069)